MVEILKVKSRKDGVKYLIIPKFSEINSGEHVVISNNMNLINKFKEEEKSQIKKKK